jgi:DHA1 family bicyclomycin/chloramphenicol resistance-like MFS transporter
MAQSQLTLSALLLAFGISQLVWGPISDRFGRKPVLVVGLFLYALASVGCAIAATMDLLITWRIMQGIAMGAVVMCGRALVRDLYTPEVGVSIMSKGLTGLAVFACISAPLGGYLAGRWGTQVALAALAVYGCVAFCIVLVQFKETLTHKNPQALNPVALLRTWRSILGNTTFLTYSALSLTSYGVLFTFLASSSFVFIKLHGFSLPQYGFIMFGMSGSYLCGTVWCRWQIKRSGLARTVAVAGAMSLLGGTLLAGLALAGFHNPWALILPYYLIAVGHGVHQPCGQTGAIGPFGKTAGTASALNGFLMMVTAFATGAVLSFFNDGSSLPMVLIVWFWSIAISLVAWTAVQKQAKLNESAL